MTGGSPAAETDHVRAAAHISPLCKVVGPPMISSTGEQNGRDPHSGRVSGCNGVMIAWNHETREVRRRQLTGQELLRFRTPAPLSTGRACAQEPQP